MDKRPKSIYVISTPELASLGVYKMGRHTGTKNKLVCRYRNELDHDNPIVYYICEVVDDIGIETIVKKILCNYRLHNDNNNLTEWVNLDLDTIIDVIEDVIVRYEGDICY